MLVRKQPLQNSALDLAKIESGDGSKALETTVSLHATLQAHKEALSELAPKIDADAKVQVLAAVDTIEKSSDRVQKNVLDLQQQVMILEIKLEQARVGLAPERYWAALDQVAALADRNVELIRLEDATQEMTAHVAAEGVLLA